MNSMVSANDLTPEPSSLAGMGDGDGDEGMDKTRCRDNSSLRHSENESLVQGLFSSAGIGQKRNQGEWGEDWNSAGDVNENIVFYF